MALSPDTRWLHDLRNAVNSIDAALMVVESALREDALDEAREFVDHARASCALAADLLRLPVEPGGSGAPD